MAACCSGLEKYLGGRSAICKEGQLKMWTDLILRIRQVVRDSSVSYSKCDGVPFGGGGGEGPRRLVSNLGHVIEICLGICL